MEALYRLLLALYPPGFRARFGRAMRADFRDLVDAVGAPRAWARALRDVGGSLPSLWLRAFRQGARGIPTASGWVREARLGVRALRRDPGFTVPALTVLALAIGIGAVVLGVVNAYMLRPLPYPEADRLVDVNPALPLDLQEAGAALEIPLTWELDAFTLLGGDKPEQVLGSWVTPGFFTAYGITPALGRAFLPNEWGEGGPAVAILSWGLWQRRFGGDPDVLGTVVRTYSSDRPDEAEVFTVVGVLPRDHWLHHRHTDLVVPIRRLNRIYEGRLRDDLSLEQAETILTDLARGRTADLEGGERVVLTPMRTRYVERVRPTLLLLASTVGLVLVIACGNVALLFLVRVQRRQRELAVRRALGASRGVVGLHLVVEGLALTLAAGVVGTAVAAVALQALGEIVEGRLGLAVPGGVSALRLDGTVLLTLVAACAAVGLGLGLLTFLGLGDRRLVGSVAGSSRGKSGRAQRRLQDGVMVAELALSLALLVAAGLSLRSARHLDGLDLGFEPEGLTIATAMLRERSYPDAGMRLDFQKRLDAVLPTLPGVTASGLALRDPIGRGYAYRRIEAEAGVGPPTNDRVQAIPQYADASYFRTLGLTPVFGRLFGSDDLPGTEPVAVVSEDLARTLWPGRDPIGQRLREVWQEDLPWHTVVGVVPEVRQDPMGPPMGDYYLSLAQQAPRFFTIYLRTVPGRAAPIRALEAAVANLDPEVAVAEVRDLGLQAREITAPGRFLAALLSAFGSFAVVLALLGLYGTVAYAAAQRRFEVAVRMALGARRTEVSRLFLRERVALLGAGVTLGLGAAWIVARLLSDQIRGVTMGDPPTYVASAVLLTAAALVSVWIPARRAARTEPMRVLREE